MSGGEFSAASFKCPTSVAGACPNLSQTFSPAASAHLGPNFTVTPSCSNTEASLLGTAFANGPMADATSFVNYMLNY